MRNREIQDIIEKEVPQIKTQLDNKANKSEVGSPLVATNVSGMTDKTKVYVNTTDGKWYSWNGTAWVVGGTYNSQGVGDKQVTPIKTSFFDNVVNNLINNSIVTTGKYVVNTTGVLSNNANYSVYEMNVEYGKTYIHNNTRQHFAFYNTNGEFVSSVYSNNNSLNNEFTPPLGAVKLKVSVNVSTDINTIYYKEKVNGKESIKKEYLDEPVLKILGENGVTQNFNVFLPAKIYCVEGRVLEIYNKQVCISGNINNLHFKWISDIGKSMKRKLVIPGYNSYLGEHDLKLEIYDNNLNKIWEGASVIKIVPKITTTKTILNIGDSLSNEKPWYAEVKRLSSDKITFVGTRGATVSLKHEGRSGFTAKDYLISKSYTYESEGVQPFWNPSKSRFDYNYYKTTNNINPNAIQIFLGTNGIALDPNENANAIKQIVDYIRQDDATIPIFVVNTLYRGNQDGLGVQTNSDGYASNLGAIKYEEDLKVFNLMKRLNELLGSYNNVTIIPLALMHDSEYNFGAKETPVNPRALQKEFLPIEATHPQEQGYMQFADVYFSYYNAILTS